MNFNSILEELNKLYDENIEVDCPTEDTLEEAVTNEYRLVNKFGVAVVKDVFGSKEEAAAYANKYKLTDVKISRTELVDGKYNGSYEYGIDKNGNITEGIFDKKPKYVLVYTMKDNTTVAHAVGNSDSGLKKYGEEAAAAWKKNDPDYDPDFKVVDLATANKLITDEEELQVLKRMLSGKSDYINEAVDTDAEEVDVEIKDEIKLVLECAKCGALVIKDEVDVKADESTDLVNIEDACAFCEETEGYKIIGILAPYENTEPVL